MKDRFKILFIHNYYQFRGGEDVMADMDISLLRKRGNEVFVLSKHNAEISEYGLMRKATLLFRPTFSPETYISTIRLIDVLRPDIVHINNFFPLISPSVLYAADRRKVPVVLFLHDFRLVCANGLLLRNARPCESCSTSPVFGLIYGCYRNSRIQTLPVTLMILLHRRILKTWERKVTIFITPSEFVKKKFEEFGFRTENFITRPNYVEDDFSEDISGGSKEDYVLFAGRLSEEKGILELISAWEILHKASLNIKLKIAGDGPLMNLIRKRVENNRLIEVLGFVDKNDLKRLMAKAKFVIVPSICHEVFGRTVIEAYAVGTPVLASRIGALREVIVEGKTGDFFEPKPQSIAEKVKEILRTPEKAAIWAENARKVLLERYTEEKAYETLIQAYARAIRRSRETDKAPTISGR